MSAPAFIRFYCNEYLSFTGHLSAEEHGAVLLLLMHRCHHGELPKTDQQMANVCRLPLPRWEEIKPVVLEQFEQEVWGHTVAEHALGVGVRGNCRPSLAPSVKQAVRDRDGDVCAYCGATEGPFEIDHIVPWSRGGGHDIENLTVACVPCNRGKSDKTPEEWLQ